MDGTARRTSFELPNQRFPQRPARVSHRLWDCYAERVKREMIPTTNGKSEAPSFEELAASQGIRAVAEFDDLLGHPFSEDESVEEFSAMLREWRSEGAHPGLNQ